MLDRCLGSVSRQSRRDFEVIVADDGSEDETETLVNAWSQRDDRIRYVHQENKGAGDARNLGASIARGKYLLFLDSDDEVDPDYLNALSSAIQGNNSAVVCCGCRYLDAAGHIIKQRLPQEPGTGWKYADGFFFTGTFAVRRDLFGAIGGYRAGFPANQHSEFRLRLLPYCESLGLEIRCVQRALVRRYEHQGPSIRGNLQAVYSSGAFILTEHVAKFQDNLPGYAAWADSVGCCAAKLHRYSEARQWFVRSLRANPRRLKTFAKLLLSACPQIGRLVWRSTPQRVR